MENKEIKIGGGWQEAPRDPRNFSRSKVLGSLFSKPKLPGEDFLVVVPKTINNQGDNDKCVGHTVSKACGFMEGIEMSANYQFAKGKQVANENPETWGLKMIDGVMSAVKFGSLPLDREPEAVDGPHYRDGRNWPAELDEVAAIYKKDERSILEVDGPFDTFDNILLALWEGRAALQTVILGSYWKPFWTAAPRGIISGEMGKEQKGFGHAFLAIGRRSFPRYDADNKIIGMEPYLVCLLHSGDLIGDHGIFYFSREVVNREFVFDKFVPVDIPVVDAKKIANAQSFLSLAWFRLVAGIKKYIKKLLK